MRSSTTENNVVPLDDPALPQLGGLIEGTIGADTGDPEVYYQWGALIPNAAPGIQVGAQVELSVDGSDFFDLGSSSQGQIPFDPITTNGPYFEGGTFVTRLHEYQASGNTPAPTGYSDWQDYPAIDAMPAAPLNLKATGGAGVAHLLWAEGSEGESSQVIECSADIHFTNIVSSATVASDTTSYDYGPLSPGTYFFRIKEVSGTPANGNTPAIPGADSPWTASSTTANVGTTSVAISSVDDAAELGPDDHPQYGYLEISRSGSTDWGQTVNVDLSGTAVLGTQYLTNAGDSSPVSVTIPQGAVAAVLEVEPLLDGLDDPATTNVTATVEQQTGVTVTSGPATMNMAELPTLQDLTVTDKHLLTNTATATDETPVDLYVMEPTSGSARIGISADVDSSTGEHVLWNVVGPATWSGNKINDFSSPDITVSLKPTPSNYDFSVFVGVDRNGNGVLDQPEVERTVTVHVYSISIDQIISDQIPGIEQNYLNGNAGVNAIVPTPKTYLLMGTDATDMARVKVTFSHTGDLPPNLGFAICPAGTVTPIPGSSSLLSDDTALITVPSASNTVISDDLDIVGFGPSLNGNDSSGHGAVSGSDPRQLRIIDQDTAAQAIKFLQGLDNQWAITPPKLPTAANFLFAFLNDFAPGLGAVNSAVAFTSFTDPTMLRAMHHHVGVSYTAGKPTMDLAVYPSTTSLAAQIAKDPAFLSREITYMKAITPSVLTTLTSVPAAGTWLTWTPGYSGITLESLDDYYSIGDAVLSGITFFAKVTKAANGDIVATNISIGGTVSDVADFDWDFPVRGVLGPIKLALVRQAVQVQARYNRIGDPGHVFEVKVQLNNSTGMGWDFTKNKEL